MNQDNASARMCHHLKGVVATAISNAPVVSERLDGAAPLDVRSLTRLLGGGIDRGVLDEVAQVLAVFRVKGDPHDSVSAMRADGIDVSPIHAVGHLNHISTMSGTDPTPVKVGTPPNIAAPSRRRIVAMIDTGVTKNIPSWLANGVDAAAEDVEATPGRGGASHGTFVAGLIRRIAPEHTIFVARAREFPVANLAPSITRSHLPGEDPSTEIHVLEAMIRLVRRLDSSDRCDIAALNLSLGAVCDAHDPGFSTLHLALDLWRRRFADSPIFAAGGNGPDPHPVYPGAFGYVRSVAAGRKGGGQVVWDRTGGSPRAQTPAHRSWITDVAPGEDLVSPSGRTKSDWVKWSGSSFASAVATASHAAKRERQPLGGVVYWPDPATSPGDVPGLVP